MNILDPKKIVDTVEQEVNVAFSDIALSQRFVDQNADRLRFIPKIGWLVWDGRRWKIDELLSGRETGKQVCRAASHECNRPKMAQLIASAKTVSSVERLAQCDPQIVSEVDDWDKDQWLFNTPAGTVDLTTGAVRDHKQTDHITKIAGTAPNYKMPTPLWDSFLDLITAGNSDLKAFLQRKTGYELTGVTREHALFFNYGTGANGKSTFMNAIMKCLGDYHQTAPIETFTISKSDRHPTELARLRGARLVTSMETEEGRRWAESRIKQLTGDDPVSARFMRQDFFEYRPQFKLDISGNHKPGLRSVDEAIRRRFNLIPILVTIPEAQRDKKFGEKLEAELPGILAWAIQGCIMWQNEGLNPPTIVKDATEAYLQAEDAISAWMEECIQRAPDAFTAQGEIFRSWKQWAQESGEEAGSQRSFIQKLEPRGLVRARINKARGMKGLRILPPPQQEFAT
jgi:putative DNA primase/helicase